MIRLLVAAAVAVATAAPAVADPPGGDICLWLQSDGPPAICVPAGGGGGNG